MNFNRLPFFLFICILFSISSFGSPSDTIIKKLNPPDEWIKRSIIYGITPYLFVKDANYTDIENKIPELTKLGVNTIWLQPVFQSSRKGQGYDITDFFSLREDLGTEQQLQSLINAAKQSGMKVIFDFVPNHTSIAHPYAQDIIKNKQASPYYDYYQHENDGAPYSSFYHHDNDGFYFYFWKSLVNLNYNNEAVQKWIIEACKYWVKKFDIDGYRFDA